MEKIENIKPDTTYEQYCTDTLHGLLKDLPAGYVRMLTIPLLQV